MSELRLSARSLTCERGGRIVFRDLTFEVAGGTALIVTGENGAGKSSLLRMIAGLIRPAAGTLALEGDDADADLAARCHYFGHMDALKNALTVTENLDFWRDFYGPSGASVAEALEMVRLDHIPDLPAGWLSAGQRRRLGLGRLLVSRRPVWLLDEPTSALDARSEARLIDLVNAHLDSGGLALIATHQPVALTRRQDLRIGAAREVAA